MKSERNWGQLDMKCKLSQICDLITDKISINELINDNLTSTYISTENMLPDKCGITSPSSVPTAGKVTAYRTNDILISNIRPYFKKIWFALNNGGCSNDVLVFRAKDNVSPDFLHYVLADDNFFDYAMKTSKGTKMPRGDKKAIMEYEVPKMDLTTQKKASIILHKIDNKIALNTAINKNLEQQAQAIFKSWFVDFEPFGGVMPSDWHKASLADIANITSGKRPLMKQNEKTNSVFIPLVGAASVMGYTNKSNHDNKILVTGRVGTHGIIQRFSSPCWTSDNTLVIESNYYEFVYQILHMVDYKNMNRGSTQPLITQSDLMKVPIILPKSSYIEEFEKIVGSLMSKFEHNKIENQRLSSLRDNLLPKLMNGEIDVSEVKI